LETHRIVAGLSRVEFTQGGSHIFRNFSLLSEMLREELEVLGQALTRTPLTNRDWKVLTFTKQSPLLAIPCPFSTGYTKKEGFTSIGLGKVFKGNYGKNFCGFGRNLFTLRFYPKTD